MLIVGKYATAFLVRIACTQCVDAAYCYRCRTQCDLYVCALSTRVSCARTPEQIEMPLVWLGSRNHVYDTMGSNNHRNLRETFWGTCKPVITPTQSDVLA